MFIIFKTNKIMKQTAVEYLIENLIFFYSKNWDAIVDQAKEMEKQQIIDAYDKSYMDRYYYNGKNGVQYYNKTFKNK